MVVRWCLYIYNTVQIGHRAVAAADELYSGQRNCLSMQCNLVYAVSVVAL